MWRHKKGLGVNAGIPRNSRQAARFRPPEEDLLLFFSRRIGLTDAGEALPLYGGVRLTGRTGAYGLGLMTMQGEPFDGRPSENYTVARVRRDVLANSDIGAIFTSREASGAGDDFNRVAGFDANTVYGHGLVDADEPVIAV